MFTVKTNNPTGRYRSFHNPTYDIKLKKKIVGAITSIPLHQIRLKVIKKDIMEDNNPNCSWDWITLKKKFLSIEEVKIFLRENFKEITERYNLYKEE